MESIKSPHSTYKNSQSWTDDLPVCKNTGIGFSTNQIYREDGSPQEEHAYEDCSCHFKFSDSFYWYAVFDGHEGKRAADYCCQRMTAEIYFSQLTENKSDEEVKELLNQAFLTVEKGYMQSLEDVLAERTSLMYDIPEGLSQYEAYQKVPHIVQNINKLNNELSSGTAAAIALIYNNKLYVANVGNCRVLLCQTDANSVLKVVQLSVDHDLKNEDELLRLTQIGINLNNLRKSTRLGNQENTRCLGNYNVKGGYKDFEDLAMAKQEPIISQPDIHGGIKLDESSRFLLLMSAGLYKSIEEATGTDQVNKYIAHCVVEQFREQATLTGVAQAVVDKAVRLHHDWYMSNSINHSGSPKREDITLVLRNFNYHLPNAITSPTTPSVTFNPNVSTNTVSDRYSSASSVSTGNNEKSNSTNITKTSDTSSIEDTRIDDGIGADQKIEAYVDFTDFYRNYNKGKLNGTLPDNF
ncbi:TGF-beta-activated kinase 1 and MAP3K7-binding protein 1-like [Diorhabda carinulata]|uniref:TGF-beta-activated kinase 1 and MAP3K7-binding protein 1-like n=1 Tax=Diorhabda carinulata TaxID=1163345 RepID=UPI0025A0D36F|nr:TGF-beta-activated kinase 1 and MAP3K7-binding protein 1-like [Diorhabda carinulata]XP_057652314.1 TGF-beta-activated kinase 1 and MAP3K7-binding protein 1-like [Diorhabda carinulata]